jgi:phospholipid/cholesterol/gamma-HCH transport system permease protein
MPEDRGPAGPEFIERVGKSTYLTGRSVYRLLNFLGHTITELGVALGNPRKLRVKELFVQLEQVGMNAIPIVALVTFLIGVVVAYLFGSQMQKYGANIFVVDGIAISMCRELAPRLRRSSGR